MPVFALKIRVMWWQTPIPQDKCSQGVLPWDTLAVQAIPSEAQPIIPAAGGAMEAEDGDFKKEQIKGVN